MITAPTCDLKGKQLDKVQLPKAVFEVEASPVLVARAVRVYLSNQRQASAKTKTRGEVAKTTAKMYRQKGTGRARHGSYSAPTFVGGGISHGPDGHQNFQINLPRKQAKLALLAALSHKAKQKSITVLVGADKAKGKTAEVNWISPGTLVISTQEQEKLQRAVRNIAGVAITTFGHFNTYQIMSHRHLLFTQEALDHYAR